MSKKVVSLVVASAAPFRVILYPVTAVSSVLIPQLRLTVVPTTVAVRLAGTVGAVVSVVGGGGTVTEALLEAPETLPAASTAATVYV